MIYLDEIRNASAEPAQLESLYREAVKQGKEDEFAADLQMCFQETPENLLYTAWYYRLKDQLGVKPSRLERTTLWRVAVPLALLTGLSIGLVAALTDNFLDHLPYFALAWAPLAAAFAVVFMVVVAKNYYRHAALAVAVMGVALAYVLVIAGVMRIWAAQPYLDQMVIHLPLLAWIALGVTLLGFGSAVKDRFAFLSKSIEVAITAGLYLIAGIAFGMITLGMLQALSLELPDRLLRFLVGGGFGLIPLIAVATVYDPRLAPEQQDFSQGLSKFIATMMRLVLVLALVVLAVYLVLIPFNFMQPFTNRDVLIVYNVMLFAVMGMLLGATPFLYEDLAPRLKSSLRKGILAAAIMALVVSLYALAAILYRTFADTLTMNRTVVIGWNLINMGILGFLGYNLARGDEDSWVERAQTVFSRATTAYLVWTLVVIFVVPLIFR